MVVSSFLLNFPPLVYRSACAAKNVLGYHTQNPNFDAIGCYHAKSRDLDLAPSLCHLVPTLLLCRSEELRELDSPCWFPFSPPKMYRRLSNLRMTRLRNRSVATRRSN